MCGYMHVCVVFTEATGITSPGAGVIGGSELPGVGAGNLYLGHLQKQ